MNIKRLTELAEWLEKGAPHDRITFDMAYGYLVTQERVDDVPSRCGASCCIAGAAMQFFDPNTLDGLNLSYMRSGWEVRGRLFDRATRLLDLDYDQRQRLFFPGEDAEPDDEDAVCQQMAEVTGDDPADWDHPAHYSDPYWAARVIRKLIATGEVDWAGCYHPEPEHA